MTMAKFIRGKPIMQDWTPGGSYSGAATVEAGDVVVIGDLPCVAHVANPPFGTAVIKDALAVEGGIYQCVADAAIDVGVKVYWDAAAEKVTETAGSNKVFGFVVGGPTDQLSDNGPTADGDLCSVLHRPGA